MSYPSGGKLGDSIGEHGSWSPTCLVAAPGLCHTLHQLPLQTLGFRDAHKHCVWTAFFCLHAVVFSGSPFHAFVVWLSIFLSANSSWEEYRRKHVAWCQHGVLWSADVSNQLGAFTRVQFQTFWILTFGMMIPNDYIIFSFLFFLFPHQPELLRCGFPTGQFGVTWRPPSIKLC